MRKAIRRYEDYTHSKDFSTLHQQQVIAFKGHLARQTNEHTGKPLSKATLLTTCNHLRGFFEWLSIHPEYRRKIDLSAIHYLNLSENDKRTAKSSKAVKFPTIEQIHKVLHAMPFATDIERRDRALFAFTILTGVRVNALVSLKLRHVDIANSHVTQDPNDVHTKFGKLIETYFFPVGDDITQIVVEWVEYLTKTKLYGSDAPLFPCTQMTLDENHGFVATGIEPFHWQSTDPVRRIFQHAFTLAGLPYYHPHTFRHTLGHMAYTLNLTGEGLKAWSQNLGHENVNTTLTSYGTLSTHRQGEVIKGLGKEDKAEDNATLAAILKEIRTMKGQNA